MTLEGGSADLARAGNVSATPDRGWPPSAIGQRDARLLELRELTPGGAQFLHALGRLGREELEAESARVLLLAFHVPARQYLYESDL